MSSDKSHIHMAATGSFTGRVGHKAGGFIAKKFFHPSNYKNQEKLWQAIEAKKEQEKRQDELLKKREEERRIEILKQEMNAGSTSSSAFKQALATNKAGLILNRTEDGDVPIQPEIRRAMTETKKRIEEYIRKTAEQKPSTSTRVSVSSCYQEDLSVNGHSEVWGSYFDLNTKQWGYACCRTNEKAGICPIRTKKEKN